MLISYLTFLAVGIMMSCQFANGGRMCGRQLTDTLELLCSGRGFHWGTDKRSGQLTISKRPSNKLDSEATLMKKQSGSVPQGIVEECCLNPCSMRTLESYCASSVENTNERSSQRGLHQSVIASSNRPSGNEGSDDSVPIPNTINGFSPQSASRLRTLESFISRVRPLAQTTSSSTNRHLSRNRQYQFFFVSPLSHRSSGPMRLTPEQRLKSLYPRLHYL